MVWEGLKEEYDQESDNDIDSEFRKGLEEFINMPGASRMVRRQIEQVATPATPGLERADPFSFPSKVMWTHDQRSKMSKRQEEEEQAEGSEEEGAEAEGEDADADSGEDGSESSEEEEDDTESVSSESSEGEESSAGGESSSDSEDEAADALDSSDENGVIRAEANLNAPGMSTQQQALLPMWAQLGPLPTIDPQTLKKRSVVTIEARRSLAVRQDAPTPPSREPAGPVFSDLGPLPTVQLLGTRTTKTKRQQPVAAPMFSELGPLPTVQLMETRSSKTKRQQVAAPVFSELGPLPTVQLLQTRSTKVKRRQVAAPAFSELGPLPTVQLLNTRSTKAKRQQVAAPVFSGLGPLPTVQLLETRASKVKRQQGAAPVFSELGPLPTVQIRASKVKRQQQGAAPVFSELGPLPTVQLLEVRMSKVKRQQVPGLPVFSELGPLPTISSTTSTTKKIKRQQPAEPEFQQLGPLPTAQPLNTRTTMNPDKIKRRSRKSLAARQKVSLPPPVEATPAVDDGESYSEESDGVTSNSEDETTSKTALGAPTTRASVTSISATPTNTADAPSRSAFVIAGTDSPNNAAAASPSSISDEANTASLQNGPAPETRTAIIAGTSVLGIALLVAALYCLFRYCVPLRTWRATRRDKHRSEKAERFGTDDQPWKWPLQFIFGHDRPAPPRRPFKTTTESTNPAFPQDVESNPTASTTMIADGFRPGTGEQGYKPTSGNNATAGWVSNGFYNPFTRLSERLSGWGHRSGTAKWFFGGVGGNDNAGHDNNGTKDSSRWSDSDTSDTIGNNARTTYNENNFINLYGDKGTYSLMDEKNNSGATGAVQISQIELTPPVPAHMAFNANSKPNANPAVPSSKASSTGTTLNGDKTLLPPTFLGATPEGNKRDSTATTGTRFSTAEIFTATAVSLSSSASSPSTLTMPPKPYFIGKNDTSHFSASTMEPATPRTFVSENFGSEAGHSKSYGVKLPKIPRGLVPPPGLKMRSLELEAQRRGSATSVSTTSSVSSFGSQEEKDLLAGRNDSVVSRPTPTRKGSMRGSVRSVGDGAVPKAKAKVNVSRAGGVGVGVVRRVEDGGVI